MIISRETICSIDLEALVRPTVKGFQIDPAEFYGKPGDQHYRLLAYLASLMSGKTIVDIGTHRGSSALALSTNSEVRITSFDIHRKLPIRDLDNVSFEIGDLWDPIIINHWRETVLDSAMIILDIDPHDGPMELEMINWLRTNKYQGLILCDDIWYFKGMRDNFWFHVPSHEKLDITHLGHWSGTGVISFVPRTDIQWETTVGLKCIGGLPATPSPWTVVTAYFDLTNMPDASPAIKARSCAYYLEHARATLALDQNLVIFCEQKSVEEILSRRPKHLIAKTRIIPTNFEELPMTQFRNRIIENRIKNPYRGDERNTASYYLLCMARYAMLKKVMDTNPFGSTHFAWLNVCIERMGYKNVQHLEDVFSGPPRDKFSTAYIDYIPESLVKKNREFWEFGRCSLCSGFFTGSKPYLYEFCNRIEEKFLHYLELGYGHADEQLFSPIYFEAPHLFETYFADYQQMVTNYRNTYENPGITTGLLIPKAICAGDWQTGATACKFLWESFKKETYTPSKEELIQLLTKYMTAAFWLGGKELKENGAMDAYYALVHKG